MNPDLTLSKATKSALLAMADDELVIGHRDSEWTGHSPILEEDIAFSNIAQDEIGHALVWFTLYEELGGRNPDAMGFERPWKDFTCSHFVAYPRSDFAYTVVRQFLYDHQEVVRLQGLRASSNERIRNAAERILREESYHILHADGLFERLAQGTRESRDRTQSAVDRAFQQALGLFEDTPGEAILVDAGVVRANASLLLDWVRDIQPIFARAGIKIPIRRGESGFTFECEPDYGGRVGKHLPDLAGVVEDMQSVYQLAPGGRW